jgi:hypothetical protein
MGAPRWFALPSAKFYSKQPAALETYVSNKNVAKLAARTNAKQFCVEGFPYGQKDQLTVHAGLHGANSLLRKTRTVSIDVPDRPHRLAFPVLRPDPSADRRGKSAGPPVRISFPVKGVRVRLGRNGRTPMTALSGTPPYRWVTNGAPAGHSRLGRALRWLTEGAGHRRARCNR